MHALLVFAHPAPDSLGAHLAASIEAALRARGIEVDRLDLYAEGFAPLLSAEERRGHPAPDIAALQARLAAADHLVLVFPTWWFGLPASLKGWFDRVWAPGFAYAPGTPVRPLLTRLGSCLVVTRPLRRVLKTALIGACAPQARFTMLSLYEAETVSADRLAGFRDRIVGAIARLRPSR
jgi:NAD(P)H-dependent FMN reductase